MISSRVSISHANRRQSIVIARRFGQLGNRLFIYGHMIGAACEYGLQVINPCFAEYAHLFPATANDLLCRFPAVSAKEQPPPAWQRNACQRGIYLATKSLSIAGLTQFPWQVIRIKIDEHCDLMGERFQSAIHSGRSILAQGWLFRSEDLFRKHGDSIREHLQIDPNHAANVRDVISRARQEADIVVGVHIRHGDYATFKGGKFFFEVSEYAKVMRDIVGQLAGRRVAFLVCSNAKQDSGDFKGLNVFKGPGHLIEDMYSFAECDLLVGPPSTYTGWASFYGNTPLWNMNAHGQRIDVGQLLQWRTLRNAA